MPNQLRLAENNIPLMQDDGRVQYSSAVPLGK